MATSSYGEREWPKEEHTWERFHSVALAVRNRQNLATWDTPCELDTHLFANSEHGKLQPLPVWGAVYGPLQTVKWMALPGKPYCDVPFSFTQILKYIGIGSKKVIKPKLPLSPCTVSQTISSEWIFRENSLFTSLMHIHNYVVARFYVSCIMENDNHNTIHTPLLAINSFSFWTPFKEASNNKRCPEYSDLRTFEYLICSIIFWIMFLVKFK